MWTRIDSHEEVRLQCLPELAEALKCPGYIEVLPELLRAVPVLVDHLFGDLDVVIWQELIHLL